jgi:hypothetical protein
MLPKLGVHDSAWPPPPVSGIRSVNFDRELATWFEEIAAPQERETISHASATADQPPPSARIPFLIF